MEQPSANLQKRSCTIAGNGRPIAVAATMDVKGGPFGRHTGFLYQLERADFDTATMTLGVRNGLEAFVKDLKMVSARIGAPTRGARRSRRA